MSRPRTTWDRDSGTKDPTKFQTLEGEMAEFEYALPQSAPFSEIVPIL